MTERYVAQEKLASGGMGAVHRVLDMASGRQLAMKRLLPEASARPLVRESFEREFQVLSTLEHPRIIRVFDYGVDELGPYYTMELLEGQDLGSAAPIPYREACRYLRDVATCLALLHARRMIHRDLSPSNVRKTPDGHCKLLDFGALMPFGRPSAIVGTPPAVPPEAIHGAALDQRTDCYALGAMAYFLLTGEHAYPAKNIRELAQVWKHPPAPPSSLQPDVPATLDELVLSLLSLDPLARPACAAEIIARLSVIAQLPEEASSHEDKLAQSFLAKPRFTGRRAQLSGIRARLVAARGGHGGSLYVEALAGGVGRTRLLEEAGLRAKLLGMAALHVDASISRSTHSTTRALARQLLETNPHRALSKANQIALPLQLLGEEGLASHERNPSASPPESAISEGVERWLLEISRDKPVAILVDNVEYADDASLGMLASLASSASHAAILLITTSRRNHHASMGLATLRSLSDCIEIAPLRPEEVLELTQSLFGDAPNAVRFADWLYGRSSGNPLHALEIVRQLVSKGVLAYADGLWTLPVERPGVELPSALEDALLLRLSRIGNEARVLAECISLQREKATDDLCQRLVQEFTTQPLSALLSELSEHGVLHADRDGYRFTSIALREVLIENMDGLRLAQNHKLLGRALAKLASPEQPVLQLEAGWHLIQGGDELAGADLIAEASGDPAVVRALLANLYRAGHALEAALQVYGKYRRSIYARVPLLAALAQSGYYEDRVWALRYGDAALDALEHLAGVGLARRLRPYLGAWLALVVGFLTAFVRFKLVPRIERRYSFDRLLRQLFSVVTTLAGTASLSLDPDRAAHIAAIIEPFSVLPKRLTPVGIYDFCKGLKDIGVDQEVSAYETFDKLIRQFEDPGYYRALPQVDRQLYLAGAHFARASMAIFRAHGREALDSADALEGVGFRLYALIASQIRYLFYLNRGEFEEAALHRRQVELHAAHVGSAWQVETWESPALILVYALLSDIVSSARVVQRLETLSREVPSLRRYYQLSRFGLMSCRGDPSYPELAQAQYEGESARSYIGWAASRGFLARYYNQQGRHADAKSVCEGVMQHVGDDDREYVGHFLQIEIQQALAEAGLHQFDTALGRIDRLLARFGDCDHRLVHGLLHEARARICFGAGNIPEYERSRSATAHWFLPTAAPTLVARYNRLAELSVQPKARIVPETDAADASSAQTAIATFQRRARKRGPAGDPTESGTFGESDVVEEG